MSQIPGNLRNLGKYGSLFCAQDSNWTSHTASELKGRSAKYTHRETYTHQIVINLKVIPHSQQNKIAKEVYATSAIMKEQGSVSYNT